MAFFQTNSLWVNQLPDGVADLVLDVPGSKHNSLDASVLADLDNALTVVEKEQKFRLLLIRSGKGGGYCQGLNRHWLTQLKTPEEFAAVAVRGQQLTNRLANLRIPVGAVISGLCMGAGLDLALACDFRVVVARPGTMLGFNEPELGLLPAWGAAQRLPRLIGLEPALKILLQGRRVGAGEATSLGLADFVFPDGADLPPEFLAAADKKRQPTGLPYRTWRQKIFESTRMMRWFIYRGSRSVLERRAPDDLAAPWKILDAVRIGLRDGMDAGLRSEQQSWAELGAAPAFRHLARLHQLVEDIKENYQFKDRKIRLRRVGVLGSGGRALALAGLLASRGYQVLLQAGSETDLGFAMFRLLAFFQQELQRGAMTQPDMVKNLSAIKGTTAFRGFQDLDVVLAAQEDEATVPGQLFHTLEKKASTDALLVSSQATHSVAQLQEGLTHPERVAALHLQTPADRSLLAEVAGSVRTSDETRRGLAELATALGRTPRLVNDGPGFVVLRVLLPYFNEAILLLREGAPLDMVENVMVRFGMPLGPLEHLDQLGLNVAYQVAQALEPTVESRLSFDGAFRYMVEHGWLGQKAGKGFYRYRGRRRSPHRQWLRLLQQEYGGAPIKTGLSKADRSQQCRDRLVFTLINEAAWCVSEGRAANLQDVNDTLLLAGVAPHRGGIVEYARFLGPSSLNARSQELGDLHGPRFTLCAVLAGLKS